MRIDVVVATKGRAQETAVLLEMLDRGIRRPDRIVVVGTEPRDVAGIEPTERLEVLLTPAGASRQRNAGLDRLHEALAWTAHDVIVFFDDDFRPAADWLERASDTFERHQDVVGITGTLLADGARGAAIAEATASGLIADREQRRGDREVLTDVHGLYGCNMALRSVVFNALRFEERLPLYSWLEDLDISGQARRLGRIVRTSRCVGVHLGVKGGRTSGTRYGYSQIVNPFYLTRKGTCPPGRAAFLIARALGSNLVRAPRSHRLFDYRGRLLGNLIALADLARGRVRPERITEL